MLPEPAMEPQRVNVDHCRAHTPEKFELLDGYLFYGLEDRVRLLRLLLVNVGLREAVKLAPEKHWREALERVYGAARP